MARVDVQKAASGRVEDAKEQRHIKPGGGRGRQVAVDGHRDVGQALAQSETCAQRRLDVGHQERRTDTLARDVANDQRNLAVLKREVIEKVAADFPRRNGHALHLCEPEQHRLARQHVALNLSAQFQFTVNAFLLDRRLLMQFHIGGHLVEGHRQITNFIFRANRHARSIVAVRDAVHALAQRRQVSRQTTRQGHHQHKQKAGEHQTQAGVAPGSAAQRAKRITHRPRDAETQARAAGIGLRKDHPIAQYRFAQRAIGARHRAQAFNRFPIRIRRRVDTAIRTHGKCHFAPLAARGREHCGQHVFEIDCRVDLADHLAALTQRDVQSIADKL